jgi:hypothetical protein
MTKDVVPAFDYGSINETHQAVAKEIASWLTSMGLADVAKELLLRFKIEENKKYDITQSKFYQICQEAGIFVSGQGILVEGEGKDAIEYPLVAINGDIRQLDKFIEFVQNKK